MQIGSFAITTTARFLSTESLNVRRYGVRLDDLEHREDSLSCSRMPEFRSVHRGHPIPERRRKRRAAG